MCLCCDLKCNRTKTLKCNIFYLLLSSIQSCEGSLIQLFLFIKQWAFIVFPSSILWMYVFVLWLEVQLNKNFEVQYFLSFVKFHLVLWSVFDPIISIHWTMSIHSISKFDVVDVCVFVVTWSAIEQKLWSAIFFIFC